MLRAQGADLFLVPAASKDVACTSVGRSTGRLPLTRVQGLLSTHTLGEGCMVQQMQCFTAAIKMRADRPYPAPAGHKNVMPKFPLQRMRYQPGAKGRDC